MSDDNKSRSTEILEEAAQTHEDQPGEVMPEKQPDEKQPTDAEADGSNRANSDG